MNVHSEPPSLPTVAGPGPARFFWPLGILWLAGALAVSLAIAWLAVLIEPHFAPLVVFPVLVGLALGTALAGWLRLCGMGHRMSAVLGVLAAVVTIVWGQHYFAYRRAQDQFDQRLAIVQQAQLERGELNHLRFPTPPESLPGFLRQTAEQGRPLAGHVVRGAGVWLWWALEAALTLAGAAVPVWMALWRPYCPIQRHEPPREGPATP